MAYSSALLNGALTDLTYEDTNMSNDESEEIIVIDSGLRNIKIPTSLSTIGVAGDQKCETIFFKVPRYFDGNDLSKHSLLIRYINAGKEYGEYEVTNIALDENFIVFGWQISNYVTRYSGTINFTVQFETVDDNGVAYQWQTVPAQLNVLAGLNIESTITDKDDALFRRLSNEVQELQTKVEALNKIVITNSLEDKIKTLQEDIDYLKDHVVYTLDHV